MNQTIKRKITYLPLEDVVTEPGDGHWDVWANCWWIFDQVKGLYFFAKNPQCNRNQSIAENIRGRLYPEAELLFMPRVCLRHNCNDYI